jgi:hypothetical protein
MLPPPPEAAICTLPVPIAAFFVPALPGSHARAVLVLLNRTAPGRGGPAMEIALMLTPFSCSALAHLQASFIALVLPRVLSHGRVYFRGLKCPHRHEDAIQEMIGLAWEWHLRLAENGKDSTRFPTALATYAARAVKSGRHLVGQEKSKDVLSPLAHQRHHFMVSRLPDFETLSDNPLSEALADNTKSPPDETVCFKLDFAAWLASLTARNRSIAQDLMVGGRTIDVADKYGVSAGRISQMRREFCQDWLTFCGDIPLNSRSHPPAVA